MANPTEADIEATMLQIAADGVASTSFSAGSSSQSAQSLESLIAYDRYRAAKRARQRRAFGIVFRQIVPPGSVNDT